MRKVLGVIGTRPEAIKMAPVFLELRQRGTLDVCICSTGQHRELLMHGLEPFGLRPDVELHAANEVPDLARLTAQLIEKLDRCLEQERPDAVLVHGDTQSCLAATLTAFWRKIPIGHVEAGLRTDDRRNPFPEETNRRLVDQLADWHFAATEPAKKNLVRCGIAPDSILVTGNTGIDALFLARRWLHGGPPPCQGLDSRQLDGKQIVLVTGHRRENHGRKLAALCTALTRITRDNANVCVVYPVHANPNVRDVVFQRLASAPRVFLIPPQPYLSFVDLMCRASVIVTDSGGIQEEAPSLGKPVLVIRRNTERPEMKSTGLVKVIGNSAAVIVRQVEWALADRPTAACPDNPCGDGHAAARIADFLERALASGARDIRFAKTHSLRFPKTAST